MDYVRYWADRAELKKQTLIHWIGISSSKFYDWRKRYGKINEHNHWIPRDFWLGEWEKQTIVNYFLDHPNGFRLPGS